MVGVVALRPVLGWQLLRPRSVGRHGVGVNARLLDPSLPRVPVEIVRWKSRRDEEPEKQRDGKDDREGRRLAELRRKPQRIGVGEKAERVRKEAEYLAQFGELPPPPDGEITVDEAAANAPTMVIPEAGGDELMPPPAGSATASDGGNAPVATIEPVSDLDAVREELRKRGEEQGNPEGN